LHSKLFGGISYSNATDQYYLTDIFNKADEPEETTFNAFATQIGAENNSLNYKQYATEGSFRYITLKYITGKETHFPGSQATYSWKTNTNHHYFLLEAHTSKYFKLYKKFTLGAHAEAVFSNKKYFQNYRATLLSAPGFYPTPHSKSLFIDKFHSSNYLAGGLNAIFLINPALNLRIEGYGFVPINELQTDQKVYTNTDKHFENYYLQGAAALVYQTGAGPLSLSVNYYEKENTKFYFSLNFGYVLFNRRGF
jgi:NTE family protein